METPAEMQPATPAGRPLAGRDVLVTRPAGVADSLCAALAGAGARVHRAPMLVIEPLPETPSDRALAQDLDRCDLVIVTSRHAVQYGLPRLEAFWPQWPQGVRWFAVGAATAAALAAHGIDALAPADARSEGLLALPALADLAGRRVLLLTGEDGRGLLESALAARGARVARLATYRRITDPGARAALDAFRDTLRDAGGGTRRIVLVTSNDTLQNLLRLAPWLRAADIDLVVASERIAAEARTAGLRRVHVAPGAGDDALLSTLAALVRHENAGMAGPVDEERA